ncbi:MAG: hypothetical protein P8Y93_01275 [Acidobacteriota bacterium]
MRHPSKSRIWGASLLIVAWMFIMAGAPASAQEPTPEPEPQAAETKPSQPATQQAPAEPATPQQAAAPKIFQAEWEIVVDGKAEANGVLSLVYQPQGGEATLVKVNVLAKAKKKEIANDLAKQLAFATGTACKVKANDNKVKVKLANKKLPPFHLGIETQAVNGVSVRVGKG